MSKKTQIILAWILMVVLGVWASIWAFDHFVVDKALERVEEASVYVEEIVDHTDDAEWIQSMTDNPNYNQFAVFWIIQFAHIGGEQADKSEIRTNITKAIEALNGFDLRQFVSASTIEDHVYGLTEDRKMLYAQVDRPDYDPKIDFSPAFVEMWRQCVERLLSKYQSLFFHESLLFELAYGPDESLCSALKSLAAIDQMEAQVDKIRSSLSALPGKAGADVE